MNPYATITRGTIVSSDEAPAMQELTVRNMFSDSKSPPITNVEFFAPAGLLSVPLPPKDGKQAEVLLAHVGGSPDHPIALAVSDRRGRPRNAKPGDTGLYDPRDPRRRMTFNEDGSLGITMPAGGKFAMTIDGIGMAISKDGVEFTGGFIKHNGKRIDAEHRHKDVQPGGGNTGVPVGIVAALFGADLIVNFVRLAVAAWT